MTVRNENPRTHGLQSAQVALVRPIFRLLTYEIPSKLQASIQPGTPILVPVGTGTSIGYVVSISDEQPTDATKPIFRILTNVEPLDASTLGLLVWAASYYCHPPGQALQMGTGVDKAGTKTRLAPTSLGRKLVETGPGLLQVGGLELDDQERRVIERLVRAKGPLTKTVLIRSTDVGPAVVDKLVRRELLERIDDSGPGPKARTTLLAKLARDEAGLPMAVVLEPPASLRRLPDHQVPQEAIQFVQACSRLRLDGDYRAYARHNAEVLADGTHQ